MQQIRAGFHTAPDNDRLSNIPICGRYVFIALGKSACRAFSVDQYLLLFSVNPVGFKFGGIVGHVIDLMHSQLFGTLVEYFGKSPADLVQDYLAVREGHIYGTCHSGKITLPLW